MRNGTWMPISGGSPGSMTNATGRQDCLVSESGLYALLWLAVPGAARSLRRWVSGSVLPRLRSQSRPNATPQRAVLHWKTAEIDTLHWQGKTWIPSPTAPTSSTAHAR